ncbi:hypothetical protein ACFVH6_09990 [Spirillospora sp. NPDC127200]
MTMLGRGKREAAEKARKAEKAEKARLKAEEAARKAREAAEEAERAAAEAEAAENAVEDEDEGVGDAKPAGKAGTAEAEAEPDAGEVEVTESKAKVKTEAGTEVKADTDTPEEDADEKESVKPVLTKTAAKTEAGTKAEDEDGTVEADEAEDDADAADDADADVEPAKRRRGSRFGKLHYALTAVIVLLAAALAWILVTMGGTSPKTGDDGEIKSVTFAAGRAAQDLSSYDFRTIDADLKRAAGHTTGKFKTEFEKQIGQVKPSATQQQTVVEGTAVKTAVESVDGDRAVALVYLNQQTAKGATAQRTPSQYTLRMTMQKIEDRWLVAELQMI